MGVFDDMLIRCPKCDYKIYDQYKPATYGTLDFDEDANPEIKEHFVGPHSCPECGCSFEVVRVVEPVYAKVILKGEE